MTPAGGLRPAAGSNDHPDHPGRRSVLILVPLNLLPYLRRRSQAAGRALGVLLPHRCRLHGGRGGADPAVHPLRRPAVYTIATILLVLLLASGLGSRVSTRVPNAVVFSGIAVWIVLDIVAFPWIADVTLSSPDGSENRAHGVAMAPLGFLMGMPFPKGAVRVGELVDWGFAVNGAASVLGATGILLIAFTCGLSAALADRGGALPRRPSGSSRRNAVGDRLPQPRKA